MKEIEEFKVDDDDLLRFGEMIIDEAAGKFEVRYECERFYINCQVVYTPNWAILNTDHHKKKQW